MKAMSCKLPGPLNLKHNLEVSHDVNRSFHLMSFVSLKSSQNHTYFISRSASMFSANLQLEPSLVKEVANHKQNSSQTLCSNPARYSEADKKKVHSSTTGKLKSSDYEVKSPVCPGYRKWRGVGCSNDWCITPCKLDFLSLNYFSYMFSLTCFNKSCSILRPAIVAYP